MIRASLSKKQGNFMDWIILESWLEFAVRWLHLTTAMAWIGSSFYFIALDLGLRKAPDLPEGAHGEEWQVHGGGFYNIQKYLVAPARLPEHLIWFKWESYMTWISGFSMLILVYYLGGELYLVDPNVLDIPVWRAVLISLGSLSIGWILYDLICKSKFGDNNTRLMILLYLILVVMAWGYTQVFTGRAALLHLGAFTATIMTANVFVIIMPNQRIVVADLKAGRTPDPKYGKIAKQRSTHNNYLTLPVIFLMLSNHYPLAFASQYNWIIACVVFLMGVTMRHFFNSKHSGKGNLWWTWGATAVLFAIVVWLSAIPLPRAQEDAALSPAVQKFMAADGFEDAYDVVVGNCSMCHAAEPSFDGITAAPKNVHLETEEQVAFAAKRIYLHAGVTNAMPPPSMAFLDDEDRALLVAWYQAAIKG